MPTGITLLTRRIDGPTRFRVWYAGRVLVENRDDGPPHQLAPVKVHNISRKSELLSPNILRSNLLARTETIQPSLFFCQAQYILQSVAAECRLLAEKKNTYRTLQRCPCEEYGMACESPCPWHDIFGGTLTDEELGFLNASLNEQLTSITRCILQRSVGSEFLDSPFACLNCPPRCSHAGLVHWLPNLAPM